MSEEQIIRHCAPTLASIKTGSLFACPCADRHSAAAFAREMNRRLQGKGLRILPFRAKDDRQLMYVYRPQKLEADLSSKSARSLLEACGYSCRNANRCLCRLISRISESDEFPHEIGLFLSYPPEDVYGFMHDKAAAKCCGCWKVYGDVDAAQRTFERYRICSKLYMQLWAQGLSIEQLTVAV